MTSIELNQRIKSKKQELRRTTDPRNRFSLEKQLGRLLTLRDKEELATPEPPD